MNIIFLKMHVLLLTILGKKVRSKLLLKDILYS